MVLPNTGGLGTSWLPAGRAAGGATLDDGMKDNAPDAWRTRPAPGARESNDGTHYQHAPTRPRR